LADGLDESAIVTEQGEEQLPLAGVMTNPEADVANDAVTETLEERTITQVPVPEHPPPDHPENVDPAAGDAVRVTEVPEA